MKKVISLLVFMVITVIMNTSCEKDPVLRSTPPTEISTVTDLEGTWTFQNFHSPDGGNVTTCPYAYRETPVLLSLSITGTICTITDKCGGTVADKYDIKIVGTKITVYKLTKSYVFYIKTYTDGVLILNRVFGIDAIGSTITTELTLKKTS